MKKRIEKVVEWTKGSGKYLTRLKKYNVQSEQEYYYIVIDDLGGLSSWFKQDFKVVFEREVLEFDIEELNTNKCNIKHLEDFTLGSSFMVLKFNPDVNPNDYDLKVIATPKEKGIEYWKEEAEKDVLKTPVSVLRYISALELKSKE